MKNEEIQPLDNAFVHGSQEQVQPTHEQSSCTNPVLLRVGEEGTETSPAACSVCSDVIVSLNDDNFTYTVTRKYTPQEIHWKISDYENRKNMGQNDLQ